jgi:branched-chain amino acid transport system substrate-binding protein
LDPKALTKIQSIILIAIIVVAAVGVAAYVLWDGSSQSSETIKIGVCADIDNFYGKTILQGAKLAAEQVNAEGGVLGRNFEIVAEDDDLETGNLDLAVATNAMTKLITVDKADFIITLFYGIQYREIAFEHKKIFFTVKDPTDELTQGVIDNYERYKYYFRGCGFNETANVESIADSFVALRDYTGFNKVAFIYFSGVEFMVSPIITDLEENGFDVVLSEPAAINAVDFSSAFAKVEEAGAEILFPMIFGPSGIPFVKEYYDRQSPMFMAGGLEGSRNDFWAITEGKCEHIVVAGSPVVVGYPFTTKTLPTRDAYAERWGEEISSEAAHTYDIVRFILPDAIERAGTIETDAVIESLEKTDIETSSARHFVFTSSHDTMMGKEGPNYSFQTLFQWQDGVLVPVYPIELMDEPGATYTFPDWSGPWDDLD